MDDLLRINKTFSGWIVQDFNEKTLAGPFTLYKDAIKARKKIREAKIVSIKSKNITFPLAAIQKSTQN